MTTSTAEQIVLERFRQKCLAAGGPRPGFVLRRAAILYVQDQHPDEDLERAIDGLVERGLLKVGESAGFIFLSTAGVECLQQG